MPILTGPGKQEVDCAGPSVTLRGEEKGRRVVGGARDNGTVKVETVGKDTQLNWDAFGALSHWKDFGLAEFFHRHLVGRLINFRDGNAASPPDVGKS